MTRTTVVAWCAAILVTAPALAQKQVAESKPVTVTATIEAIDPATRTVTLKGPDGNSVDVAAPDQIGGIQETQGRRQGRSHVLQRACRPRS